MSAVGSYSCVLFVSDGYARWREHANTAAPMTRAEIEKAEIIQEGDVFEGGKVL